MLNGIALLQAHPHVPLAASTGSSGKVAVWAIEPVELVSEVVPSGGHPAVAVTWLEHPRPSTPGARRVSTLLVCTHTHLLLYPFVLHSDVADPTVVDLLHEHSAAVALASTVPAGAVCTLDAIVSTAGDSAVVVLHASTTGAPSQAVLLAIPSLAPEPLQEQHVHVCPATAAQCAANAARVSRIHGGRALLAVSPNMPPQMSVLAVDDDALEQVWSNSGATERALVGPDAHVLGVHASVPCGTAAVLCDFPGLPRKLSLWTVAAAGGSVALIPEQSASVADAAGDVHVMAVGLGHAAVAVAGSRGITLWMRCPAGWAPAVRTAVPGAAHTLAATPFGLLAGLPAQLLLFEATVDTPAGCVAIGGAAAAAMPPQPLWHPGSLLLLLLQGVHGAVAGLLRQALSHARGLRQGDVPSALKHASSGVLTLQVLAAAMLAVAEHTFPAAPTRPEHGSRSARALQGATAGGAVAGARDRVAGLTAYPSTDSGALDQFPLSCAAAPRGPASSVLDASGSGQLDLATFGLSTSSLRPTSGSMASGEDDTAHLRMAPPQPQPVQSPLGASVTMPHARAPTHRSPSMGAPVATPMPQVPTDSSAIGPDAVSQTFSSEQVSLSAFGMAPPQPQQTARPPSAPADAQSDPMASGQVDLAAFGMAPPQPQQSSPAAAAADPMASGQVDLAAFGMAPPQPRPGAPCDAEVEPYMDPSKSTAVAPVGPHTVATGMHSIPEFGMDTVSARPEDLATEGKHVTHNPLYSNAAAPTSRSSRGDAQGQALGESTSASWLDRAASFEMHFPEPLLQATVSGTSAFVRPTTATPRLGRPEAIGEAVGARQPEAAAGSAVVAVLQQLHQREAHCAPADEQLTEQELQELKDAVLPQRNGVGGARAGRGGLISGPGVHALLRLAELVTFSGCAMTIAAQVQGLDVAGRRAVSAARTGAALLQAQWDTSAGEAEALAAEVDGQRSRRRHKMSFSQSALLAKLKGGGSVATGGVDGSHMSHSAALSSIGGDVTHNEAGAGLEAVQQGAVAACTEAWGRMHVLPTLQGVALHWAFDCKSPRALLEAAMGQMPAQERGKDHGDAEASGMEAFFAVAQTSGPHSPWTWQNFRRIGAALWLREATDVTHAAERIAQATYAARKDPYEVAVWYCAQGRRKLLAGMLRSKGDSRVADFLGRDFTLQQQRAAAAKNAHKLLSQHRYPLAASFFLLAHDVPAALATCLEHLHDVQLAIMLARVVEACGTVAPPPGRQGYCADLFAQLIAEDAVAECPALRALLWRAAGERFTVDQAALDIASGRCRCVEAHLFPAVASAGPLARAVGAGSAVQAADWMTRTVLCNMSTEHARTVPEVAGVPAADVRQALGNVTSHAAHACEHIGHPHAAMALKIRSMATSYSAHDSGGGGSEQAKALALELRRETLAGIAGLHAQCMQSFISGQCMKGVADSASSGSGGLLFADEARLLAQVQASRPVAAAAAAWYAASHQEDVLRSMCGADAAQLQQLQQDGLAPEEADLAHGVSQALGLATVVQEQPSTATAAHRLSVAAHRALEASEPQSAGPLRPEGSYSICSVGDKDAQVWPPNA